MPLRTPCDYSDFECTSLFLWVWCVWGWWGIMTHFLHERLVLDGPSRPIHFLIFKNHLEEKSFLSFSSSSPIRPFRSRELLIVITKETCWKGPFNEASKPPCLWSRRLHYSLNLTEWSRWCSTLPSSLSWELMMLNHSNALHSKGE